MRAAAVIGAALGFLASGVIAGPPIGAAQVFRDVCIATAPDFEGTQALLEDRIFRLGSEMLSRSVHVITDDFTVWLHGDPAVKSEDDLIVETGRGHVIAPDGERHSGTVCLVVGPGLPPAKAQAALADLLHPDRFIGDEDSALFQTHRKWIVEIEGASAGVLTISGPQSATMTTCDQISLEFFDSAVMDAVLEGMPQ